MSLSDEHHSPLNMRRHAKDKKQDKATTSTTLVEATTPINLLQSEEGRRGTQQGRGEMEEDSSSSEGEEKSNSEPFEAASSTPIQRGADLKKQIIPNVIDFYINGVSLANRVKKERSFQEKPWGLAESLQNVPELVYEFERYELGWMIRPLRNYMPELVHEFYANI